MFNNKQENNNQAEKMWLNDAIDHLKILYHTKSTEETTQLTSTTSTNTNSNTNLNNNTNRFNFLIEYDGQQINNLKSWKQVIRENNKVDLAYFDHNSTSSVSTNEYNVNENNTIEISEKNQKNLETLETICHEFNLNEKQQIAIKYFVAKTINNN